MPASHSPGAPRERHASPLVRELPLLLEPVTRDPFIDPVHQEGAPMHPLLSAQLAREIVDERVRAANAAREVRRCKPNGSKAVRSQRRLVWESLLRLPSREERS